MGFRIPKYFIVYGDHTVNFSLWLRILFFVVILYSRRKFVYRLKSALRVLLYVNFRFENISLCYRIITISIGYSYWRSTDICYLYRTSNILQLLLVSITKTFLFFVVYSSINNAQRSVRIACASNTCMYASLEI